MTYSDQWKTVKEHLEYRRDLLQYLDTTKRRKECLDKCRDGVDGFLFWLNRFAWLYEPRTILDDNTGKPLDKIIPFKSWPSQEKASREIFEVNWACDIGIEKSRGEGASWIILMILFHQWLFEPLQSFGLVSHKIDAVDKPKDLSTLMPKLDWQLTRLPEWMRPQGFDPGKHRNLRDHTLMNPANGSIITGYPAIVALATGARLTAAFMDELSKFPAHAAAKAMTSMEPVTECRILASTPFGAHGPYYDAMHDKNSDIRKIRMHWADNPSRNRGLYRVVGGLPMAVDPANPLPAGYAEEWKNRIRDKLISKGFNLTHGVRSPWYDKRCLRPRISPRDIAQEYDIDYIGSASKFFSGVLLDKLAYGDDKGNSPTVKVETVRGEIHFNTDDFEPKFVEAHDGRLRLWVNLEGKYNRPPPNHYVIGADPASGQGGRLSANSVLAIGERDTGIKVAEFASNIMPPEACANLAIALCWFFEGPSGPAYLIWEDNGLGSNFRNQVIRMGFRNFYIRTVQDDVSRKKSKKPGWRTNHDNKALLLGEYQYALQEGMFVNPCAEAIEECRHYERLPDGKIEFDGVIETDDPNASKHVHGDRVIADAVLWHAISEFTNVKGKKPTNTEHVPETSFAHRRKTYIKTVETDEYW